MILNNVKKQWVKTENVSRIIFLKSDIFQEINWPFSFNTHLSLNKLNRFFLFTCLNLFFIKLLKIKNRSKELRNITITTIQLWRLIIYFYCTLLKGFVLIYMYLGTGDRLETQLMSSFIYDKLLTYNLVLTSTLIQISTIFKN